MLRYAPDYNPYSQPPSPTTFPAGGGGGMEAYRFIRPPGMPSRQSPGSMNMSAGGFLSRLSNGMYGDYLNRLSITGRMNPPMVSMPGQYAGGGT